MAIKVDGTYYIDLTAPEGNALWLGGQARDWLKQLGEDHKQPLWEGARSYDEVLDRFDALFKGRISYKFLHDPRNPREEDDDA